LALGCTNPQSSPSCMILTPQQVVLYQQCQWDFIFSLHAKMSDGGAASREF
jgi:hypothetical protein